MNLCIIVFWILFTQVLSQRCPVGWLERHEGMSCYRFWPTRLKSWEDARETCHARGGDLLNLNSFEEKEWIISQLNKYPVGYEWWIGLRRHTTNDNLWMWTDGSERNETDNFLQWGSGEPNNYQDSEDCAEIWDNLLNDKNCNHPLQFVCERPKDLPMACDVENGWDNVTPDRCYKVFRTTVTYADAFELCKRQDAEIMSIEDENTQQNISDFLDSAEKISVWLPYTADSSTSEWKNGQYSISNSWWSAGSQDFDKIEKNDTFCAVLDTNITESDQNWKPTSCDDVNAVVCSKPKGTCPSGYVQHNSICYLLNTGEFMTWNEASGFCNLRHTTLLEIKDEESSNFMYSLLKYQYSPTEINSIWLGLAESEVDSQKWMWLSDSMEIGDFETKKLEAQSTTLKSCVFIDIETNQWTVGDCAAVHGAVCTIPVNLPVEAPPVGRAEYICDGKTVYGNSCYSMVTTVKTDWFAARSICKQQGMDLVTIVSQAEQEWLESLWTADFANEIWIGLNDQEKEGTFQWLETSAKPVYTNWMNGQPNNAEIGQRYSENCVAMFLNVFDDRHGKWVDYPCSIPRHFVCERPADLNIAPGKLVLVNNGTERADRLVDSCTDPSPRCAHLINPSFPNILIDLGAVYHIKSMNIFITLPSIRGEPAYEIKTYVNKTQTFDNTLGYEVMTTSDKIEKIHVNESSEGRYIRIEFRISAPLLVTEVQVFADESVPLSMKKNSLTKDQVPCVSISSNWKGNVSYTLSGRLCQAWAKDFPHRHSMHDKFIDQNQEEAENFCRDPFGLGHLWCYTVDPDTRWEFCSVETCAENGTSSTSNNTMLTWSDATQVCAIDGNVLPMQISEDDSVPDGLYWLSVYYDANEQIWYSTTSGLPVTTLSQDVIDMSSSPNTLCAVGNCKGQIFAKNCFERFPFFCAETNPPFYIKTSSNEAFKEVPANYIDKTDKNFHSVRFEFKGYDGATIKLQDYTIRIGGNLLAKSYITRGDDGSKIDSTIIENLCSDSKYKAFWVGWIMNTVCKISVGRGLVVGKNVFLQYNNCPDTNVQNVRVSIATVMKTTTKYDGIWKFKDPVSSVVTSSHADAPNIALNKQATQISSYSDVSGAEKAVDGCKNPVYSGRCITHTRKEDNPWWEVDLGRVYAIKLIVIRRRWEACCKDRLGYFQVFISKFRDSSLEEDIVYKSQEAVPPETIYVQGRGKQGRFIRIMIPKQDAILELAEVEVYEDTDASLCGKNWLDYKDDKQRICYKFSEIVMSWETAREFCNGLDAKMVIPGSADEQLFLYGNAPFLTTLWLGIHDIVKEGTYETFDKSRLLYTDWGAGEPNNFGGDEDCAVLRLESDKAGRWNDAGCSSDFIAVCTRQELTSTTSSSTTTTTTTPTPTTTTSTTSLATSKPIVFEQGACKPGWTFSNVSNTCMKIVKASNIAVVKVAAKCLDDNSVLASIANSAEQNFLKLLALHLGIKSTSRWDGLWLGGIDAHAEGQWQWFMRNTTWHSSLQWAPGQPDNTNNEDCVMMSVGQNENYYGRFNDLPCDYTGITAGYICQYDPESVSCETGWVYNSKMDSCYKLETTPANWYTAVKKCEDVGGNLVSIRNQLEQFFIGAMGASKSFTGAWIGASHQNFEWSWVDKSISWFSEIINSEDLFDYYSNGLADTEYCGTMQFPKTTAAYLKSTECSQSEVFICAKRDISVQRPSTPTTSIGPMTTNSVSQVDKWLCGAGWDIDTTTGMCFKFAVGMSYATTWAEAQQKCSDEGGSLASIVSNNEQSYIIGRLQGMLVQMGSTTGIWIGATDSSIEQKWHWENRDPFAYLNWAPGQPDNANDEEHCLEIQTDRSDVFGLWSDAPCNLLKGYLCKKRRYTEGTTVETPKPFIEYTDMIEFYQASEGVDKNFKTHDLFELGVRLHDTFTFEVKTKHDAHILLQNKRDTFDSLAYLVIIGGWGNTRSIVTEMNGDINDLVRNDDKDLLSSGSYRPFWITWNDTTILVGKSENVGSSVLLTFPSKKIEINFVSVATAQYTDAYWKIPKADKYYGCDGKGWLKYDGTCFLVVQKQKSWEDANSYCNQEGGDLASIADQNEQNFIFSHLPVDRYCFNIHDNDTECIRWAERGECDINPVWMSTHCHHACALCMTNCRDTYESPEKCMNWASMGECGLNHPWMLNHCAMSCGVCTGAPTRGYWIGLHSFGYEQSYTWVDNTRTKYTNWASHHPQAFRDKKGSCVGMFVQNGEWNDGHCTDLLSGFICRKPLSTLPVVTTQSPWKMGCSLENAYGYGDYCYRYQTEAKPWYEAQGECEELGGTLAYIRNRYIQAFLTSEMLMYSEDFWIGLNVTNQRYSWAGQSETEFTEYFREDIKEENMIAGCFAMSSKKPVGLWNLYEDCKTKLPYICQTLRDGVITSTTAVSTAPLPDCPVGWSPYSNYCYKLIEGQVDWDQAKTKCTEFGASMVSIHDEDENAFVSRLCRSVENGKCWVGLHDRIVEGVFRWEDGTSYQYNRWGDGEPNNVNNEDCVEITRNTAIWNDVPCHAQLMAVCKIPRGKKVEISTRPVLTTTISPVSLSTEQPFTTVQGGCTQGWASYSNYCYKLVNDYMNWFDAKVMCNANGAFMVSIHDVNENAFVASLCDNTDNARCWIGLHDIVYEGDLLWDDGTRYQYNKWGAGEPNNVNDEDCVEMRSAVWNDVPCHVSKTVICKMSRGENTTSIMSASVTTQQQIGPMKCQSKLMELYRGHCYALFEQHQTISAAHAYCYLNNGMSLASIHSERENAYIHALLRRNYHLLLPQLEVWLGLFSPDNTQGLEWLDKTPVDYSNFEEQSFKKTTSGCVNMNILSGKWRFVPCLHSLPYLCKGVADEDTSTTKSMGSTIANTTANISVEVTTETGIRIPPFHDRFDAEAVRDDSGLSGGQIAGIVVGVIGILVIVAAIVYVIRQGGIKQSLYPLVEEQSLGFDNALFRKDQDTVSIK